MSLSDDDTISPTTKNRASRSQEPRKSLEDPFLGPKETTITQEEPRKIPQEPSFLSSKEIETKSETSMSQKPRESLQDPSFTHKDPSMAQEELREIHQQSPFLSSKEPQETSPSPRSQKTQITSKVTTTSLRALEICKTLSVACSEVLSSQRLLLRVFAGNFGLGSGENMESGCLQRDIDKIKMIPSPGFVNSSTNDKNNNGKSYFYSFSFL